LNSLMKVSKTKYGTVGKHQTKQKEHPTV